MADWIDYWNDKDSMSGEFWQKQADFFVRQVRREMSFGPEDIVLDIGCGQGHVLAALAPLVKEALGMDTSSACVRTASTRYAAVPNLRFQVLPPENYLAVDAIPVTNVTRILCVSVVQYYKSLDELHALVRNAKKIAAPGCRMVIADLLLDYNLFKDIAGVLLGGLQSGTFLMKLREAFSGKHSLYKSTRDANPVLTMTRADMERICAAENASLRFLPGNLTGNWFRGHALVTFDGPPASGAA